MNLRTQEEFLDEVARELSWRRREWSELKRAVESAEDGSNSQAVALKAALALLYSHWEGFVKKCAEAYLNYVDRQRLTNKELSDCMFALIVKAKLHAAGSSNKAAQHLEIVRFLRQKTDVRSRIPQRNLIRTESNLSSTVLVEILDSLDIETAAYESKFKLLDKSLLDRRNHIAHGEESAIDLDDYLELHAQIIGLIEQFRTDVENSVIQRKFAT